MERLPCGKFSDCAPFYLYNVEFSKSFSVKEYSCDIISGELERNFYNASVSFADDSLSAIISVDERLSPDIVKRFFEMKEVADIDLLVS